ncbi:hypothetical protein BCR42DRAFT_327533 [Absidia repens]|uniref:Uncharacterized protein n=1 Tax=Absidia repens TaxID=90262 RepID=A0A1X2IHD5_9FUNG|nr:hypothetical protein BCR42DRAFT_327533 [Absidia repens]
MDTLYTHSMRYPDLIHVNARSEEYLTHRRWQLHHQDGDLDIHTGYANLRYGAIIPRSKGQLFVNQFAVQKTLLYQRRMADVFFSFWTNSYPYIVSNPLPLFNAVRRLKNALADHSPYFVKSDIELPLDQRDVRTACENDKCLFVTNIDLLPLSTEYNPDQNLTHSSLGSIAMWKDQLDMDIPEPEFWRHRGYHAAVDGDSTTCWNTFTAPKQGDYFGLDLIGDMRASRLLIQLRQTMEQDAQDAFTIRALNKDGWEDCSIVPDLTQSLPRRMVYQMTCPDGKPISAIRVFFKHTQQRPFDLCAFGLDNFLV